MAIEKKVFDFLRSLDGDNKEKVGEIITHLEQVSTEHNKSEENERKLKLVTDQIGETPISDLLAAHKFVSDNGGEGKVIDAMHSGEEHKAENERLKAQSIADKEAFEKQSKSLQAELDQNTLITNDVLPVLMERFNSKAIATIRKMEGVKFAKVGDTVTYDGMVFSSEGIEALADAYDYALKTPNGGGGDNKPNDPPRNNVENDRGIPDDMFH